MYAGEASGLDMSMYSAGIIAADLLSRLDLLLDYPRQRMGFRRPRAAKHSQGLGSLALGFCGLGAKV